ncbi:MAG: HNH endonuclease, partial [Bacteroidia bacterium]|nr:HNH endonuclease [Bacteroidia bacterium]
FTSKSSGNSFVEAHHLIPMSEQTNYEKSLDVEANIVALCPNCHRKVHLATDEEAQEINNFLLNARHDRLVQVGLRSNGNN